MEEAVVYDSYSVGDHVQYNNITYYVIEDSDENNDTVKLLKENPLLKVEIDSLNLSGITVGNNNGYGTVQYGSSTDYSTSTIKQVVDAWKNLAVKQGDNATARLITLDEMIDNLGYIVGDLATTYNYTPDTTPEWVKASDYVYWINNDNDNVKAWNKMYGGNITPNSTDNFARVRPVLELNKSADITVIN